MLIRRQFGKSVLLLALTACSPRPAPAPAPSPQQPLSADSRDSGRKVPNLVLHQDSEKGIEFWVKLEIGIPDPAEATTLLKDLANPTQDALKDVWSIVSKRFDPEARPAFKAIVYCAIQDAIDSKVGAGKDSCPPAPAP